MGHQTGANPVVFWLIVIAIAFIISLFFRPVRVWLWGTWQRFQGYVLGRRAEKYVDTRRAGAEIDHRFNNIKDHYLKETVRDIQRFTNGDQKRVLKRLSTLRKYQEVTIARQIELEEQLAEESKNPPRERPRIKGILYYSVACLLALADIAITFMSLQALNYPVIFLLPSAVMLGVIGFLAGDFLGKNIEPAQKNPNKDKNRMAIILLASFSLLYCVVFGTMRFVYTQHDPTVPLTLNIFGSYGFISIIVGCSVMLGWLHEGITTKERLAQVKAYRARLEVGLERCDKQGAKMTEAFRAHLLSLESESALVRSQFRSGFDSSWTGRAPYGVEAPDSPLGFDEEMLKSLTWPDPPSGVVTLKPREKKTVDYTRYEEPPAPEPPVSATPIAPAQVPIQQQPSMRTPQSLRPHASPLQDGPPPIG